MRRGPFGLPGPQGGRHHRDLRPRRNPPRLSGQVARRGNPKPFQRTDRIGELVREIVASELERIGDERLDLVTVTAVKVDGSLERAEVFYSAFTAQAEDRLDEVEEALEDVRWPIQKVVNRQVRARHTPQIRFSIDDVLNEALRIEEILHDIAADSPGGESADSSDDNADGSDDNAEGSDNNADGSDNNADGSDDNAEGSDDNAEGFDNRGPGDSEAREAGSDGPGDRP
ncbi:MAG: 30S ribosome-binding factor RbfA [Microthrixaceae bacterium]